MSADIDFFADDLALAPDYLRKALVRAVEDTLLDGETQDTIRMQAWHPDTTVAEATEVLAYCEQHRRSARDYYAPSQRLLASWIRSFCLDD